ncbi:vinorine synthase-like [Humulus lupulus]|uniref:vinorine synthase-like n=1 Tax=Humulus lupulus TaxID=3486 RepID=UPI002B40A603|nr:vinorine synthase-like [Humulus lupulus]
MISTEIITPSSPTPPHLKTYLLSSIDQFSQSIYGRVVYFYTHNIDDANNSGYSSEKKSQQLKKSLSKTLARFYPFAGRINNNTSVDCNDEGAPYVEAKFNGLLSTFLDQRGNVAVIDQFFPAAIQSPEAGTWPILRVQATFFDCGGLAVGVCLSHKLCDARSMSVFMKSWAETSKGLAQKVVPIFDVASYFPPGDYHTKLKAPPSVEKKAGESVTKMYVFDKDKIVDLKAKVADTRVQRPSRVEVVTALIWKIMIAVSRSNGRVLVVPKKTTYFVTQTMDIRKRAEPAMPEELVGNLVTIIPVETNLDEPELQDVVAEFRNGVREFGEKKGKRLRGDGALNVILEVVQGLLELLARDDTDGVIFTSLCTFKLYEIADFGWGKPTWVNILPLPNGAVRKLVTLMDTRDGGVEAWVTMDKEEMALFECHPQLLQFATHNYSTL